MNRMHRAFVVLSALLTLSAASPITPKPLRHVTITAREYAFTVPATLSPGPTAFHFVNRGAKPHEVQLFRFNRTLSANAARAYLVQGTVPDSVADRSGSVLIAAPGDSVREALLVELRGGER